MSVQKSWRELEAMARANRIVVEKLDALEAAAVPGVTTKEMDRIAREHIERAGARPAHFSGSFTSRTWFDATFSSTWTVPLGQRTSSFVTVSSFPRPKWTRMSDAPP